MFPFEIVQGPDQTGDATPDEISLWEAMLADSAVSDEQKVCTDLTQY